MQNKRERELKDIKMRERSLKALDAIIGELYVIDSKEELDQVYNGTNAVERLKALDAIIGELYVIDSKEELDQVYNGPNVVERLKALDAIIGELYVIDSKEELDQVYNGPNVVERLKDQIRFRSLVRGEKITLKANKKMLYERLLCHITESEDLEKFCHNVKQ